MSNKEHILSIYQQFKSVHDEKREWNFLSTVGLQAPRYKRHAKLWNLMQSLILQYPDETLDLLWGWQDNGLTEEDVLNLFMFCRHGGSVAKEHNVAWHTFYRRLREHQDRLPEMIQHNLSWQLETHQW